MQASAGEEAPVRGHERAAIEIEDLMVSYGRRRAGGVSGANLRAPAKAVD